MLYYKFQPINKLSLQNLNNQKVWVADPYLFNDPFEFSLQDNFYIDSEGNGIQLKGEEYEIRKEIEHELREYGVVCFSKGYQNNLLWSHYTDNHEGMCLVFDIDEDVGDKLFKVDYTMDFPIIDLSPEAKQHDQRVKVVTTKSKEWEYEEEYRLVYMMKNFLNDYRGKLVEIIFGCRATFDSIKMVASIARNNDSQIKISRVRPQPNTFKLTTITIPTGSDIPENWNLKIFN